MKICFTQLFHIMVLLWTECLFSPKIHFEALTSNVRAQYLEKRPLGANMV